MYQDIYFAGGCFWGMEKYFKLLDGVVSTEVGFANGNTENPTYKEVYTDTTGYAECVHVVFDTEVTNVRKLAEMFFHAIDPTSLNKQGDDQEFSSRSTARQMGQCEDRGGSRILPFLRGPWRKPLLPSCGIPRFRPGCRT